MDKSKYQTVLELSKKLNLQRMEVSEEDGKLKMWGTAPYQYQKNLIWDEIKRVGGENPSDFMADIKVADESVYARHTVQSGESLSKISKQYYGSSNKYNQIFEANRDKLKSPDLIHPGDELIIPKP